MGIKPIEFVEMTYRDYVLICIGHKDNDLKRARERRKTEWIIYCSYADPKKSVRTMQEWQPIEGDVIPKIQMPTAERLEQYDNDFKNLGKRKK